jgi:hypothetical protein
VPELAPEEDIEFVISTQDSFDWIGHINRNTFPVAMVRSVRNRLQIMSDPGVGAVVAFEPPVVAGHLLVVRPTDQFFVVAHAGIKLSFCVVPSTFHDQAGHASAEELQGKKKGDDELHLDGVVARSLGRYCKLEDRVQSLVKRL